MYCSDYNVYIPNRPNVIDVAGGIARSAVIASVAMLLAPGHAQGEDPSVPGGRDLSPSSVGQGPLRLDRQ